MADAAIMAAARAPGKVAVLMGGDSAEREISLRSGAMVLAALQRQGVDAHAFDPALRALDELRRDGFARAFIALHGRHGEDGTVQGALELLGIPYTGSGVTASAIAIDKMLSKRIWQAAGLPTPAAVEVRSVDEALAAFDRLGPCVLKPVSEGSTLGLSKVLERAAMADAFALASRYEARALAETFIVGRELTVAVIGEGESAQALPTIEICAPDGNYDYQNKYFTDDTRYLCPAPLPEAQRLEIEALAVRAYRELQGGGWGRVDLMLDEGGRAWLLELNTSPGMTDHSLVPMAARAVGTSYDELVLSILDGARLRTDPRRGADHRAEAA
ncbi:MAG: D-alanine--D-alanine ligase [Burkholderiaceae bacterium]